jgi:phosphoglucosamine mutase
MADRPVSVVCRKFEPVPQLLTNVRYANGKPLEDDRVKNAVKDAESRLGNSGRLVIRASGTEPLIRIMAECDDEAMVKSVVDDIANVVREVAA